MTDHLTEDDLLAAIPGLTRTRLFAFIETEVVIPVRQNTGDTMAHVFRQIDLVRLQLLCELADDLELDDHTEGRLHVARHHSHSPGLPPGWSTAGPARARHES